jgi:two-component system OmpR family sensor kinase/two-component system sensor histidine kinase BaeS
MIYRLRVKLTLAFVAVALLAVGVVALLSLQTTGNQFRQYIVHSNAASQPYLAEALTSFYVANGGWTGVEAALAEYMQGSAGALGLGRGMGMMGRGGRGISQGLTLADATGRVVYDSSEELTGKRLADAALAEGAPLLINKVRVGTLLNVLPADVMLDAQGQAFLDRVRQSLLLAGLAAVLLALLLGFVISWRLTAPVRQLTHAAGVIAGGDLTERVPARGRDEIADLGRAFNQMAASLEAGETLRRNLMADVAHELRTPLTVIQGNLQAILDGVYPLDETQVAGLYDETRLLTRLVDDLRELALAEAGQLRLEREPVDLVALAQGVTANFMSAAEAAGVKLSAPDRDVAAQVVGDADRLGQVLRNLLSNALRHTPAGQQVAVRVETTGNHVALIVADTGTGIAAQDLPHVFDRFYRGNKSRGRRVGSAGLGLAIARQLVRAHGGEIGVESAEGAGTTFTVRLPIGS